MPNFDEVQNKVTTAIAKLLEGDRVILARNASERAISHHLACYLANQFPEWQVDVEYNRTGDTKKRLLNYESRLKQAGLSIRRFTPSHVYPDIIIHHREADYDNLLVIELKKSDSKADRKYDLIKLQCLQEELGYCYTLFIILGVGRRAGEIVELTWSGNKKE